MRAPCLTIKSQKIQQSNWYYRYRAACRSMWRARRASRGRSMWSQATWSRTSKQKCRPRAASRPTKWEWSSRENSLKTGGHSTIIIFRRNLPCIWFSESTGNRQLLQCLLQGKWILLLLFLLQVKLILLVQELQVNCSLRQHRLTNRLYFAKTQTDHGILTSCLFSNKVPSKHSYLLSPSQ